MLSEIAHDHNPTLSLSEASSVSGYSTDYLSRLCKSAKIIGVKTKDGWSIDRASLVTFIADAEIRKQKRAEELSQMRKREYERTRTHENATGWYSVSIRNTNYSGETEGARFMSFDERDESGNDETLPALKVQSQEIARTDENSAITFPKPSHSVAALARIILPVTALCIALVFVFNPSHQAHTRQVAQVGSGGGTVDELAHAWYLWVNRSLAFLVPTFGSTRVVEVPVQPSTQVRAQWDLPEPVPPRYDGAVVVPRDEAISPREQAKRIAETFSDEVIITANSDGTGVITPVFKSGTSSGEYLYVMVPIATSSSP
jgi:hypothetical protein